jgi:hypothetical protein
MKTKLVALSLASIIFCGDLGAFCGFYVAKAPADLFNDKSEVILVRDGTRTVITMSNDFRGGIKDFAMVVPVPTILREDQIRISNRNIFDRLDAYSAPRLVEYYDSNPCSPMIVEDFVMSMESVNAANIGAPRKSMVQREDYKVTVEATYSIGEYDILILSAEESDGLEKWLTANGYKIPQKAASLLEPYVKSNTKFFVVKVNLDRLDQKNFTYLNPLQIEFDSDRFMLPIRLGMANAQESQDMVVYAFTRQGRVEPVNYRTVKIPTDRNVPLFVETYFGEFYQDLFNRAYHQEKRQAVFLEYAWNVSPMNGVKCDPCVSPPPVFEDFKSAGVNWINGMNSSSEVFFTRLHVRYSRDRFPQDLRFQVTPNRENFQARYILNHPAEGDLSCEEGRAYLDNLRDRRALEIQELGALAGWSNPNYEDYINEYSDRYHKYRPNRNDIMPVGGATNNDPESPGQMLFFALSLLGIGVLWALRMRSYQKAEALS